MTTRRSQRDKLVGLQLLGAVALATGIDGNGARGFGLQRPRLLQRRTVVHRRVDPRRALFCFPTACSHGVFAAWTPLLWTGFVRAAVELVPGRANAWARGTTRNQDMSNAKLEATTMARAGPRARSGQRLRTIRRLPRVACLRPGVRVHTFISGGIPSVRMPAVSVFHRQPLYSRCFK